MLTKLTGFTKKIGDLPDKPTPGSMTAAELKAYYDSSPEELRLAFNLLIDAFQSVVDGDSGADNIAVTAIAGLTGVTVQSLLEALKTLDDENRAYLLSQIQGVTLGQIPDGSITQAKLAFTIASTAADVSVADVGNYFTGINAETVLQEVGLAFAGSRTSLVASVNGLLGS